MGSRRLSSCVADYYLSRGIRAVEGDSLEVQVAAYACNLVAGGVSVGGGGADGLSVLAKGSSLQKKAPRRAAAQTMALNSDRAVLERIGKLLANNSCAPGKAVVESKKNRRVPTGMALDVSLPKVAAGGRSGVIAALTDGKYIPPGDLVNTTTVDYFLGAEAQGFGGLNGPEALTLPGVDYGVTVFATFNEQYNRRFPLLISVGATAHSGALQFTRSRTLTLSGPATIGEYFNQGDSRWSTDTLDTYVLKKRNSQIDSVDANGNLVYGTIQKAGCTVSCIAMVLKAFGCDVDPRKLNAWMKDNNAFDRRGKGNVKEWTETIAGYPGSPVTVSLQAGEGLSYDQITGALVKPPPPSLGPLDLGLADGYPSIVQVLNPTSGSYHWVVVTGKTMNGCYTILDPGSKDRVLLDPSKTPIYKYREILPKLN